MIAHPAAYALLLLSFQSHLVYGELPTTIVRNDQSTSDVERNIRPKRQPKKGKKGDDTTGDVEGNVDTLEFEPIQEETPKIWPTYVPSPFVSVVSESPHIVTPTIVTHFNCGPIGSRTSPAPRPTRNNPVTRFPSASPLPKIDPDTYTPTENEEPSPVTFRRGDLLKDITRLGIKGEVHEDCLYCVL